MRSDGSDMGWFGSRKDNHYTALVLCDSFYFVVCSIKSKKERRKKKRKKRKGKKCKSVVL